MVPISETTDLGGKKDLECPGQIIIHRTILESMFVFTYNLNTQGPKAGQHGDRGKTLAEITKQNKMVESTQQETGWGDSLIGGISVT